MPAEEVVKKRILVLTGGDQGAGGFDLAAAVAYDLVIAADSGLDLAESIGIRPDVVVGDLDSASPDAVERARAHGAEVDSHPAGKDHTDFELALERAMREGASEICVIGGAGGRPDHWLSNLALLAATAGAGLGVTADMGDWRVSVVTASHPYREELPAAELLSLLAIGGDVLGITTEGLLYPLREEPLTMSTSRGVSNVAQGGVVRVEIQSGTLLVMRRQQRRSDVPGHAIAP
ncbi:MAG TPA: thiamine diphosphokinase [Acidimicrobiales bacterium]|nr:thiamine diphosphokinase [Acidimicrobiales bacterium]